LTRHLGPSTGVDLTQSLSKARSPLKRLQEHSAKRGAISRAASGYRRIGPAVKFRPNKDEYASSLFGRTIRTLTATSPWMARTTTTKWSAERSRTFPQDAVQRVGKIATNRYIPRKWAPLGIQHYHIITKSGTNSYTAQPPLRAQPHLQGLPALLTSSQPTPPFDPPAICGSIGDSSLRTRRGGFISYEPASRRMRDAQTARVTLQRAVPKHVAKKGVPKSGTTFWMPA